MRIEQAIAQAQIEINRKINSNIAIGYINNIQQRLAINIPTARIKESVEIESTDTRKYHKLSDYVDKPMGVENVKVSSTLSRFKEYEVEDKEIRFLQNGTFRVKIEKLPSLNSLKTEEINLPMEYHIAMSKWISFKELDRLYGSEDNSSKAKEEEFWTMVSEIDKNIKKQDKKPKKIKAPRW